MRLTPNFQSFFGRRQSSKENITDHRYTICHTIYNSGKQNKTYRKCGATNKKLKPIFSPSPYGTQISQTANENMKQTSTPYITHDLSIYIYLSSLSCIMVNGDVGSEPKIIICSISWRVNRGLQCYKKRNPGFFRRLLELLIVQVGLWWIFKAL